MLCLLFHTLLLGAYNYIIRTYLLYKVYLIVTLIARLLCLVFGTV